MVQGNCVVGCYRKKYAMWLIIPKALMYYFGFLIANHWHFLCLWAWFRRVHVSVETILDGAFCWERTSAYRLCIQQAGRVGGFFQRHGAIERQCRCVARKGKSRRSGEGFIGFGQEIS